MSFFKPFKITDLTYNAIVQFSLDNISRYIDNFMQADAEVMQILQEVRDRGNEILKDKSEMYKLIVSALSYIETYYDAVVRSLFVHWGVMGVTDVFDNSFRYHLSRLKTAVEESEKEGDKTKENIDAKIEDILKHILYEMRSPHEMNISTLQNYFDENRQGWWREPNLVAQIISDAGKMLHDFAIIFTNIYNELEQQISPSEKSVAHEIINWLKSKEYAEYLYFFAIKNFINIQAKTGHSVKIDIGKGRVYGHIGDFSPVIDVDTNFYVSNEAELYEFVELITQLVYYEQLSRNAIVYLDTNFDVLHKKQRKETVDLITQYWHESQSIARKLNDKYVEELHINNEEWYDNIINTTYEELVERLKMHGLI